MSDSYEELKQKNLSDEGREKLEDGGYYEVTISLDWTHPPVEKADTYATIDFVLNDDIEEEFFSEIDFESEDALGERENSIAISLNHNLDVMLERGLILDAYDNDHIQTVDDLKEHVGDFRIIGH